MNEEKDCFDRLRELAINVYIKSHQELTIDEAISEWENKYSRNFNETFEDMKGVGK